MLKPPAGVSAQKLGPARIVLERRSQAMGESGYPGPGHALLIGYTASPLQPAGRERRLAPPGAGAGRVPRRGDSRAMPSGRDRHGALGRRWRSGTRTAVRVPQACRKTGRMMRSNPLVTEVLAGLTRHGKAQLDYLGLLALQAVGAVRVVAQGRTGAELLESQHGPHTLTAVVMAVGVTTAYFALRAGAEEIMLPGQHGLRDWALATPLGLGRILRGYVLGQLVHSLHLLALSSPLLLMAFTVSGGEWVALGWCMAATLVQALFYRLCGAITHLTIGQHRDESRFAVRTILARGLRSGRFVSRPHVSHVAFTSRALGERVNTQPAIRGGAGRVGFPGRVCGTQRAGGVRCCIACSRASDAARRVPDGAGVGEAARDMSQSRPRRGIPAS